MKEHGRKLRIKLLRRTRRSTLSTYEQETSSRPSRKKTAKLTEQVHQFEAVKTDLALTRNKGSITQARTLLPV